MIIKSILINKPETIKQLHWVERKCVCVYLGDRVKESHTIKLNNRKLLNKIFNRRKNIREIGDGSVSEALTTKGQLGSVEPHSRAAYTPVLGRERQLDP